MGIPPGDFDGYGRAISTKRKTGQPAARLLSDSTGGEGGIPIYIATV